MDFRMTAFRTLADVTTEAAGFTVQDGKRSFSLLIRLKNIYGTKFFIRVCPDLLYLVSTHEKNLLSYQKDW